MALFVPLRINLGVAQAKRTAKIDDLGAGFENAGRNLNRDLRRRTEEDDIEGLTPDGFRIRLDRLGRPATEGQRTAFGIGTVLEQNDVHAGVARKNVHQLCAAVAAKSDDTDSVPC